MKPCWLPDTVTTDLDRMVSRALLWGFEALELRLVGGPMQRVPDVNEPRLRRRLEESELGVEAIVPGLFEGLPADRTSWLDDLERLVDSLKFCRRIGCPRVVVSAFADGPPGPSVEVLRRAGDRAAREGLEIAVLNEPGGSIVTGGQLADLLAEVDHPAVRAAWDPATDGDDAPGHASRLADRLTLLRADPATALPALLRAVPAFDGPVSFVLPPGTPSKEGLALASRFVTALRGARQSVTPR